MKDGDGSANSHRRLRSVSVCTPFEVNGGQVALDDPRVEAGVAFRPLITGDVPEEPLRSARLLRRCHHRQHGDGVADEAHGVDAAQAVRIEAHRQGRLVQHPTPDVVGDQPPLALLDHPHRLLAAHGGPEQAWRGVDRGAGARDLPALMVGPGQL